MDKIVAISLIIISFNVQCMQQASNRFSAEDRNDIRIAIARYIFQKQNGVPLAESQKTVMRLPAFESLKNKPVIHEFNNSASLDDDNNKLRYYIDLTTNKISEEQLKK